MSFQMDSQGFVNVWTDGACINNGAYGARAGIGVFFADNHPYNVSCPIPDGYRPTNNVAEILAATEAARQAKRAGVWRLRINTDSQFMISCGTEWMKNWKRNGWRKADGNDVINQRELIEMDNSFKSMTIQWRYVQAHSGEYGNEQADRLAKAGANEQNNY